MELLYTWNNLICCALPVTHTHTSVAAAAIDGLCCGVVCGYVFIFFTDCHCQWMILHEITNNQWIIPHEIGHGG